MPLRSFPSLASLSEAAAREFVKIAKKAIAERGQFTIALSGGETPRTLYETLSKEYQSAMDWNHVHVFFGDERFVPHDDPASNYRMAKESLLEHVPIPLENIHPINTALATPEKAASDYSNALLSIIGGPMPSFDLILLGLGNDGHTASLFPGMSEQEMNNGIAISTRSPIPPTVRISLTMDVINAARNVFFLVAGEEKKQILKAVLTDEGKVNSEYPVAHVHPRGELIWFVDEAAIA